jgi:UDP-N-acetylmuramyl pentapeptide phosphotransferase/UDP-N-acetylglucosamine-1-phosphate transferase
MTSLMLPATLAFLVVLFGMPSLIMVAKRKHLVDEPSEARKLHHRSVPTVGGVMLFAATVCSALVSFALSDTFGWTSVRWLGVLGASVPIFFMGLKDDIMGMAAVKKLMVHLAVGGFLVLGLNLRIDNFDGLFGLHELPLWVSSVFSLFVYVVIVNSINLIDGIDGLAGGYGLVAMSAFGMWAHWTGDTTSATVAAAMVGALAGFLLFNLNPAKIFMGDSGSLLLGFMAYVMAVNVVQTPASSARPASHSPPADEARLGPPLELGGLVDVQPALRGVGVQTQFVLGWVGCHRTVLASARFGLRCRRDSLGIGPNGLGGFQPFRGQHERGRIAPTNPGPSTCGVNEFNCAG